jgi:menaquinone-dependent protoporphyrinogen oxidase
MKVLVGYASRHGATAGIAERIAAGLREAGLSAEARPISEVSEVGEYDAFVIGAAAYVLHWMKDATRFVKRHRRLLAERPVWLFSSGPLGTDLVDEKGRDIFEATRPKEFDELKGLVHPSGERVFFGAWDPDAPPVGLGERLVSRMPAARTAIPAGDFRDWPAIDAWAADIARELHAAEAAPTAQRG